MTREEDFDDPYYEELAQSKKVIGVGECGLDMYHVPKDKTKEEVLEKQKQVFLAQVRFAQKHDLPLVIHCREAHDQMIQLLKSEVRSPRLQTPGASATGGQAKSDIRGTIHCFTSNWTHAQEYLNLGFYLGFTGVVTFPPKKSDTNPQLRLNEVVENVPLDRVVIETDAPYLAPQAYRGRRAEPWMVEEVVKRFAAVRHVSVEDMANITTANARRLFKIS